MSKMIEKLVDIINDISELFKEKEYVCYYVNNNNSIKEIFLTKKELCKFINEHQLSNMKVYKIKDRIKIERELRIEEDKQC